MQSTLFFVPVPAGFSGFQLATLQEFAQGAAGSFCAPGRTCFGESITTSAPGIFSAANPAHLQTTIASSAVLKTVKEDTLAVSHQYTNGTIVTFTTKCSGAFGTPPPLAERPCRRAVENNKLKLWQIDIWDNDQGNWGFS